MDRQKRNRLLRLAFLAAAAGWLPGCGSQVASVAPTSSDAKSSRPTAASHDAVVTAQYAAPDLNGPTGSPGPSRNAVMTRVASSRRSAPASLPAVEETESPSLDDIADIADDAGPSLVPAVEEDAKSAGAARVRRGATARRRTMVERLPPVDGRIPSTDDDLSDGRFDAPPMTDENLVEGDASATAANVHAPSTYDGEPDASRLPLVIARMPTVAQNGPYAAAGAAAGGPAPPQYGARQQFQQLPQQHQFQQQIPHQQPNNESAPPSADMASVLAATVAPPPVPSAVRSATLAAMTARADETTRHGFSLAERGAIYAARAEFIKSLRLVAQALDADSAGRVHAKQLSAGLRALVEADDFVPEGSRLETDRTLQNIVATHRTPVLKDRDVDQISQMVALEHYYAYAQAQLSEACGAEPAASHALFGLGKMHSLIAEQGGAGNRVHRSKSIVFHQAALRVTPANHLAANELGVMLAEYGQLETSRQVLEHCVAVQPMPEAWHNLAVVYQRIGDAPRATFAQRQWQGAIELAKRQGTYRVPQAPGMTVQWVEPGKFAKLTAAAESDSPATPTASAAPPVKR